MVTNALGFVQHFRDSALALSVLRVVVHQDALRSGTAINTITQEEYGSFHLHSPSPRLPTWSVQVQYLLKASGACLRSRKGVEKRK